MHWTDPVPGFGPRSLRRRRILRRTLSLLLLFAWLPTLFGAGTEPLIRALAGTAVYSSEGVAAHDVGPRRPQPAQVTDAGALPQTTVRIDSGPEPVPPAVARPAGRHAQAPRLACAASAASETRRLDCTLLQTRARSGFLTAASSTAPPRTLG